ncbi:hypothetical protein CLV56_3159 [Mumia flava]|uniref:Uncharacterized protein n=1 Tax=Mumia flava TaxID=1348852 RepID=A0A0B2BPU9_9ACTN|nr:hypothetical protein [Mumia flava]PJJ53668.1 hypothetical protein CLV56_3159 [Mumia flava]
MTDPARPAIARVLLVAALAVVAGLLAPTPASAAVAEVRSRSGVLYDDCFAHPFRYDVDRAAPWTLRVRLADRRGRVVDTVRITAADGASGRGAFEVCARRTVAGRFTVRPTLVTPAGERRLATTRVRLRKPRTWTRLRASDARVRRGQRVRLSAVVREERALGRFPSARVRVRFQARSQGRWRRIGSVRRTRADGRATVRLRLRRAGRTVVRAKALPTPRRAGSAWSRTTVRVRPRR